MAPSFYLALLIGFLAFCFRFIVLSFSRLGRYYTTCDERRARTVPCAWWSMHSYGLESHP
jgi:hypothetical protein